MDDTQEVPVCGWKAVGAVFARRPESVRRLFFDPATGKRAGDLCALLARERRVYRQVAPEDLVKIAGTVHHGGIVAITARERPHGVTDADVAAWSRAGEPLLVLDRVGNAHNLGALVRTAAFFGVARVILGETAEQARPGEAAHRVAEGGMEYVELRTVRSVAGFLKGARLYFQTVGAALEGVSLQEFKPVGPRPVALVLGNEEHGLSPAVLGACEHRVHVRGAGAIESLNVSAAGAVLLHWFFARA